MAAIRSSCRHVKIVLDSLDRKVTMRPLNLIVALLLASCLLAASFQVATAGEHKQQAAIPKLSPSASALARDASLSSNNSNQADLTLIASSTIPTTTSASTTSAISAPQAPSTTTTSASTEIQSSTSSVSNSTRQAEAAKAQQRRFQKSPSSSSQTRSEFPQAGSAERRILAAAAGEQQADANRELIDQASTSQSVSFAEPTATLNSAGSSGQQQQQSVKQKASAGGNRWTHFGARLRPLNGNSNGIALSGDHQAEAASNSKALKTVAYNGRPSQQSLARQLNGNQLTGSEADELEEDDDQDSEALLYKMMQQQSFLMGPTWPQETGSGGRAAQVGSGGAQRGVSAESGNQAAASSPTNNKRVIKLMKSLSHIQMVDDTDEQIRGTQTRIPGRAAASSSWQRGGAGRASGQQHRSNARSNAAQGAASRRQPMRDIFVSSQPLTLAYSGNNQDVRQPEAEGDDSNYANENGQNGVAAQADEVEDEFECPNNGIFADEASGCQAYHVCQSGAQVQQKFQCPLGTLFNNIILTCDFAHNVQCGDKSKQQAAASGLGDDQQIFRQPQSQPQQPAWQQQPQQIPKASGQVNQNSYVRQQQQRPAAQPAAQRQQLAVSAQQAGPRQLKIGSQYNRHNQEQSIQAQTVATYPRQQSQPTAAPTNEIDDDNDSDEPLQPLVAATLPPNRPPATILPYNPPPPPQVTNYQHTQPQPQQQYQPTQQPPPLPYAQQQQFQRQQHQSAHRSQYPEYQPSGYNDGASAVTPIFASRDEHPAAGGSEALARPADKQADEQLQSFNLVINHLATPTRQAGASNEQQANGGPKLQRQQANQVSQAQAKPLASSNKPQLTAGGANGASRLKQAAAKQPPRQRMNNEIVGGNGGQRQQQQAYVATATQPKSVHVDAEPSALHQPASANLPAIVDLTNDKTQSSSVSSEALNDGLLLIVRHSPISNPIQVVSSSPSAKQQQDRSARAGKPQQQQLQLQQQHRQGGTGKQLQATSSQAFAVDPKFVRPNSPVDAQLFPNVQRVLAAGSGTQASLSGSRAAPPEPPKLTLEGEYNGGQQHTSLQASGSSSNQQQTAVVKRNPQQVQQRSKRAKRLKAVTVSQKQPTQQQQQHQRQNTAVATSKPEVNLPKAQKAIL